MTEHNIAFVAHLTRPEFDKMQDAIRAMQVPYTLGTWGDRVRYLAEAEAAVRKRGFKIVRLKLTAEQVLQFAQLTEGNFRDPEYRPGMQLAMLIGQNRMERGMYGDVDFTEDLG